MTDIIDLIAAALSARIQKHGVVDTHDLARAALDIIECEGHRDDAAPDTIIQIQFDDRDAAEKAFVAIERLPQVVNIGFLSMRTYDQDDGDHKTMPDKDIVRAEQSYRAALSSRPEVRHLKPAGPLIYTVRKGG